MQQLQQQQQQLLALLLCGLATLADTRLSAVPESLRGTPFGLELAAAIRRPQLHPPPKPLPTQYLEVPLDHAHPEDPRRHRIRYWVVNASWDGSPNAPLHLGMPSEGGCGPSYNFADNITATFRGLGVHTEHRFFGESVPGNESSVENLAFLSVDQNLADLVALVGHVKEQMGLHKDAPVIAEGGSYSGDCLESHELLVESGRMPETASF